MYLGPEVRSRMLLHARLKIYAFIPFSAHIPIVLLGYSQMLYLRRISVCKWL